MPDILQEYFLNPILSNGWFNPVNTAVYAVILIVAVFFVFKLLKKLNIKIDKHFIIAVLPFIFWGSSTRVLHDAAFQSVLSPELNAFYGSAIFPTPGSYIITFGLALIVLLISLLVQRLSRLDYWKTMFGIGVVFCGINVVLTPFILWLPLAIIVPITIFWTAIFLPWKKIKNACFSWTNLGILGSHFLDASATFTAISFLGYAEQHVLPRFLMDSFGPMTMFPLKAVVVVPVLIAIDKSSANPNFKTFLKLVVLILGLAPGLRTLLRLMVGV